MIRHAYSPPLAVQLEFPEDEKRRTKSSMKDECDVNVIVRRYLKTGVVSHVSGRAPQFADVSGVGDWKSAMDEIAGARQWFEHLPSEVRNRFRNDPAQCLDFLADDENREEAVKLGLLPALEDGPPVEPAAVQPEPEVAPGEEPTQ